MTERQQELVYELAGTIPEGGMIVELGVCHGKTAVVLACAAKEKSGAYLGVDNWSLEGSKKDVHLLLDGLMHGLGIRIPSMHGNGKSLWDGHDFTWELWEIDTHGEDARRRAGQMDGIDLLLIDAGHDEANVIPDCEVWIPLVRPGGLVVFDDVPSGAEWAASCHWAVRVAMEAWTESWEWAASYGKVVARRRPMC